MTDQYETPSVAATYRENNEEGLLEMSPVVEDAPYRLMREERLVLAGNSTGNSSSNSHSSNSSSHSASSSVTLGDLL